MASTELRFNVIEKKKRKRRVITDVDSVHRQGVLVRVLTRKRSVSGSGHTLVCQAMLSLPEEYIYLHAHTLRY